MEQTLIRELSGAAALDALVHPRIYNSMYWMDFFPLKPTPFISFETIIGSKGAPVAADVVAWDVSAPIKSRKKVDKLTGDLSPIKISRVMSEKQMHEYRILQAMNAPLEQILPLIYDDIDYCFEGINARLEWMALQALSNGGKLSFDKTNNGGGIVTENTIDFRVPSDNKTGVAVSWATIASSTPLVDIRAVMATARANGHRPKYMLMSYTAWSYFSTSTAVKDDISVYYNAGSRKKLIPDLATVNVWLRGNDLPTIIIVENSITTETAAHVQTTADPWEAETVAFIPDIRLGSTLHCPTAEEMDPPKQALQTKRGHVLLQKYSEVDPVAEHTVGIANAFPSWPTVDSCYFMDTTHATTWTDPS